MQLEGMQLVGVGGFLGGCGGGGDSSLRQLLYTVTMETFV